MSNVASPLFGLLTTLLMWWFLGDILDNFANTFMNVIAFSGALVFLTVFIFDLFELLQGRSVPDTDD